MNTLQLRASTGPGSLKGLLEQALRRLENQGGRRVVLGPLGEALLLDTVAAEAQGPLKNLHGVAGLRRSLARTFVAAGCAGLSLEVLPRLAERLSRNAAGQGVSGRVAELGRLYARYRSLLGSQRIDGALAFCRGVRALAKAPLPLGPLSDSTAEIVVTDLHRLPPWDEVPTPYGSMLAFGALSSLRPLRVVLPAVDEQRPALEQALRPLLDSLYQQHAHDIEVAWAPLGPQTAGPAGEKPWGRFLRGLFLPASAAPLVGPQEIPSERLTLTPLSSPASEARHVAQSVAQLLGRGVAPGEVAIVAESAPRRARIVQALLRYDVPVHLAPSRSHSHAHGLSLGLEREGNALPPPLLQVLGLYDLLSVGTALPREGLIALLTTRYLRWPMSQEAKAVQPFQIARALRGAGVRDLALLAGADSAAELHRRISEWQRQQHRGHLTTADDAALLLHIEAVLGELRALPERAPLGQHVFALRRLCERLQLHKRAAEPEAGWLGRSPLDAADDDPEGPAFLAQSELLAAECGALARDQAALAVFEQALDELPRHAQALRLHEEPLSRARFAALLRAALGRLYRGTGLGAAGRGVEVSSLAELSPRPFSHLFVIGLLDGELPAPAAEDPLLDDDERGLCNRLLDAPVFPLSRQAGQRAALHFAEALAHAAAVHLSWPIADEEGRPLLRSPFVETVLHAAARGEPQTLRTPLLPPPDVARHEAELWTFAGKGLRRAPPGPAQAAAQAAQSPSLLKALSRHDRRRASRLFLRVQMEAARASYFAAFFAQRAAVEPGPLCGQLSDPALIAALAPRLPGSRARPLSASALEDYARCPFRFFVYRVLGAAPIPEGSDDLDPLARGNLYHKVLETFFAERRDRGKLPLAGGDDDRQALEQALAAALEEFTVAERGGHPGLFQIRLRRLRAELWQLITREAQAPIEAGCAPALFEHKFGPLAITAGATAEEAEQDSALHIGGVIDRIDLGPGRALVLDYKTGRLERYQHYLREELLETSFQLPLYAAAVQADPVVLRATAAGVPSATPPRVTARYYAVREAQVTEALDDQVLLALDPATRLFAGERNVAEAAYRLWRRLRGGDFRVAPRTCDGCGLETVCRIAVPPPDSEAGDESLEQDSASSSSSSRLSAASPIAAED